MDLSYIVLIILSWILITFLLINWIMIFNRTDSKKFSFFTFFPFELNPYRRQTKQGKFSLSLLSLLTLLMIVPIILFAISFNYVSSYVMMSFFIIAFCSFLALLFIKLSNYYKHLIFVSIFVTVEFTLLLLMFFYFSNKNYGYSILTTKSIICIVLLIIQMIFEFILIFNPNYKNWAKMVKMDAEIFSRPKYCYLAMLEWGTFLNLILNYIPISIILLF